ncbi:TPA: aspartyl protease family protein [Elizabethkingia anophelis]
MTKQIITSILLIIFIINCRAQSVQNFQPALDNIFKAFKNRDYDILKPYLDPNMKIGDFPRGKNDMIVPQILAQLPVPESYSVTETIKEGENTRISTIYVSEVIPKMKRNFLFNKNGKIIDFDILIGIPTKQKDNTNLSSLPKRIEFGFHVHDGIIFTKAMLNGKEETFILDSGAPELFLNSESETVQKMTKTKSTLIGAGVGGSIKDPVAVIIDTFNWNGIEIKKGSAVNAMPMRHLLGGKYPVAGLIGYDIFKNYKLIFDYKNNKIIGILNTETYTMPGNCRELAKIPIEMKRHIPILEMTIEDKKYKMGLDTGAATNLLYAKYAEEHKKMIKETESTNITGISGTTNAKGGYVSLAKIGTVNYENMRFVFEDSTLNQINKSYDLGVDGLLGYEFLKPYIVSVDFKAKEIRIYEEK